MKTISIFTLHSPLSTLISIRPYHSTKKSSLQAKPRPHPKHGRGDEGEGAFMNSVSLVDRIIINQNCELLMNAS